MIFNYLLSSLFSPLTQSKHHNEKHLDWDNIFQKRNFKTQVFNLKRRSEEEK